MTQFIQDKPIDKWLDISQIKSPDDNIYQMSPSDKHLGNPAIRAIHGGVVTIFMERLAEIELLSHGEMPKAAKLISTNVNFLRSSRLEPLFGSAKIIKLGRRLAVIDVFAWQDKVDLPVAKATLSLEL